MRIRCRHVCVIIFVAWAAGCTVKTPSDQWTYRGEFHDAISAADQIVVRDGGFNCCRSVDDQKVLFRVADPREIKEVADHIQFQSPQVMDSCLCCGYPGIDWYKDGKRVALTSIQHYFALRWKGFPGNARFTYGDARFTYGDARFTQESSEWIVTWLAKHGITRPKEAFEAEKLRKTVEQEARLLLCQYLPAGYLNAIERAEAEAKSAQTDKESAFSDRITKLEDKLKDKYIRGTFQNKNAMYVSLFQILGCLPMRWTSWYLPEQYDAYEFLTRAPREELDEAIRSAMQSKDKAEKQGAARLVFSQLFMTDYDKTKSDISQWMAMLADAAYADPFPENRQLVLHRLSKDGEAPALDVFEHAVGDPDRTVRLKAINALQVRGGPEALQILRQVAAGTIQPRAATALPTDYAKGTNFGFFLGGVDEEECSSTDQELASAAIEEIEKQRPIKADR